MAMPYSFAAFTLFSLFALIILWIILSIPIYISADILAKKSTFLQAMEASFLMVLAFALLSLIPVLGVIIWIVVAIIIIAVIYDASFLRAIAIAVIAIIIVIILSIIFALLGLAVLGTVLASGGLLLLI